MNHRIFSKVVVKRSSAMIGAVATLVCVTLSSAYADSGYYTDPATGIIYRKVTKTIERPVVETTVRKQEKTVYRPETVTETRPETRTVYSPVIEYNWEPKLHGRWNPFRQPTLAYHHVPRTRWEQRSEVVQRVNTRTQWVAEKRTVEIPERIVRVERNQEVQYEPVGRVSPGAAPPTNGSSANGSSAIASRLRPLAPNTPIAPLGSPAGFSAGTRIASTSVGRLTSDPPRRNPGQGGLPAKDLTPGTTFRGQALPPAGSGSGIANLNPLPFLR